MCKTHAKAYPEIYIERRDVYFKQGMPAWPIIDIVIQNIGDWLQDYCFWYEETTTLDKGDHNTHTYKTMLKPLDDIDELRTGVCI